MDGCKLVAENNTLIMHEFETLEPEYCKTTTSPFAEPKSTRIEVETDGLNPQHIGVINAWGGAILRGEPLVAHGSEGINGLTLSNAMHMSSWLGKTIELPLDADAYYAELKKRIDSSKAKSNVNEQFADTSNSYNGTGETHKRWNSNW